MNLTQFFRIIWARRAIIAVAIVACITAAAIGGNIIPSRYQATSRLILDIVKRDPVTGEMLATGFARAYVKTQTELIQDYRVAGRVVDMLGWTSSPRFAAQYQARPEDDSRDFRRWLSQRIIDGTNARLVEGSSILEITYTSNDPQEAATVADTIRQAYVDQSLAFKREDAARNATWFRQQAVRTREELREAEKRKSDFERANGIVLDADNIDQESRRLSALASIAPVAPGVVGVTQPNPMAAQLAQADAAIASAEKVLGPNHPNLINMRRQRAAIEQIAAKAGSGTVVNSGPSIGALYGAQQAKVLAQRGKVDEARQLATEVAVLRDQYQKTVARATDLEQQGEVNDTGLTLLGSATAPQSPAFPNWPLLIFGSLGLGAALGVLMALLVELLNRRVRGIEDLQHEKVPVLGMITVKPSPPRRSFWNVPALLRRRAKAEQG